MPRTLIGRAAIFGLTILIVVVAGLAAARELSGANLIWVAGLALLFGLVLLLLHAGVAEPLRELAQNIAGDAGGEPGPLLKERGIAELVTAQQAYNRRVLEQRGWLATAEERSGVLLAERDALRTQLDELRQAQPSQPAPSAGLDQLYVPILPVLNGVLVAPIVGVVDERRADYLQAALLEAIQSQRARVAILDLTGLISVDPFVIKTLLQSAQSAKLLGAQPIIVGITPEVAEVLVQLGLQLREIMIMADLQAAVSFARTFIYKVKATVKS